MEQEPDPRGSPHLPQEPGPWPAEDEFLFETAKTDSCVLSFELAHFGQDAFLIPKTRASKRWSHFSQMYSKIGIKQSLR
jgi:hypothetical protein